MFLKRLIGPPLFDFFSCLTTFPIFIFWLFQCNKFVVIDVARIFDRSDNFSALVCREIFPTKEGVISLNTFCYNEKEVHTLTSTDYLCDVDDEFGLIAKLMSDNALNSFNKNGVPPHSLQLKVNDICLITRAMMVDNLPSNARVIQL